ncbi:MAG: M23 family metallopeptidase [Nitriliruptorales bacterium]
MTAPKGEGRPADARLATVAAATVALLALGAPLAALEATVGTDGAAGPTAAALDEASTSSPVPEEPAPTPEPEEVVSDAEEAIEDTTGAAGELAAEASEELGLADDEEPAPSPSPSPTPKRSPDESEADEEPAAAKDAGAPRKPAPDVDGKPAVAPDPPAANVDLPEAPAPMPPVGEYVDHLRPALDTAPRLERAGVWRFEASGPRSTAAVIELVGAAPVDVLARIVAPFPVAGPASYSDDWGAPRHTPYFHRHEGTDVFAARGTPVVASTDGVVSRLGRDTAIGGNSLRVAAADGTFFYYAHLDGFARDVEPGASVSVGQVIGYVGDSGNAAGTPPHLHFEIHPDGGPAVPPVPHLDRWLADALRAAQSLSARPVAASPLDAGTASRGWLGDATAHVPGPRIALPPTTPATRVAGTSDAGSPLGALAAAGLTLLLLHRRRRPARQGPRAG